MTDNISTAEAARILKVTQRTIQRMIQSGKLIARALNKNAKRVIYIIERADLSRIKKNPPKQ